MPQCCSTKRAKSERAGSKKSQRARGRAGQGTARRFIVHALYEGESSCNTTLSMHKCSHSHLNTFFLGPPFKKDLNLFPPLPPLCFSLLSLRMRQCCVCVCKVGRRQKARALFSFWTLHLVMAKGVGGCESQQVPNKPGNSQIRHPTLPRCVCRFPSPFSSASPGPSSRLRLSTSMGRESDCPNFNQDLL